MAQQQRRLGRREGWALVRSTNLVIRCNNVVEELVELLPQGQTMLADVPWPDGYNAELQNWTREQFHLADNPTNNHIIRVLSHFCSEHIGQIITLDMVRNANLIFNIPNIQAMQNQINGIEQNQANMQQQLDNIQANMQHMQANMQQQFDNIQANIENILFLLQNNNANHGNIPQA
jgi:hypothetical protein